MKNLIAVFFLAAVFFALTPTSARAQEYGFYFTPKIFYSHIKADVRSNGSYSDNVAGAAMAIGYDFNTQCSAPIRLELELAMRGKAKYDTVIRREGGGRETLESKTSATSIFANVYYDFHNQSDFTPYIGAGLGTAYMKIENRWKTSGGITGSEHINTSGWDVAWNMGAGLAYKLNEQASLDFGYRYADLGTLGNVRDFDNNDVDGSGHEVLVGVRFTF